MKNFLTSKKCFLLATIILISACKVENGASKQQITSKSASNKLSSAVINPTAQKGKSAIAGSASASSGGLNTLMIDRSIPPNEANEIELINDPYFSQGISVIPACKNPDSDPSCANGAQYVASNPYGRSGTPVWSLGQWGSKSSLPRSGAYANGGFSYFDANKSLTFTPNGEVILAVNGMSEFDGAYKNEGIGFIIGQNVSAPGDNQHESGTLDQLASLKFSIDMQLLYSVQNITTGYNASKHAVIFPINFTIQNLNRNSPGYGQYVWFQIMPYGDRGLADFYAELDIASNSFIYAIPDMQFAKKSVRTGDLVHLSADILADAKKSVQMGFDKGMLKSSNISDYHVGGLNIGFELTGLNISTIVFSNFSLKAKKGTASTPPTVEGPRPAPASSPVAPVTEAFLAKGFYRIGKTDGIFFVNGGGGSCVFTSWSEFLRWGGKSDASNVTSVVSFPKAQVSYGACQ